MLQLLRIVCLGLLCAWCMPVFTSDLVKTDLFVAGDGYPRYRIPVLIRTAAGTLIAGAEARAGGSDWGRIDLVIRRSRDNGQSWEPQQCLVDASKVPVPGEAHALAQKSGGMANNLVLIPLADGRVVAMWCLAYARVCTATSADDGVTWSEPQDITAACERVRSDYNWKVIATGPGHGIQLAHGRLVVPVWYSIATSKHGHTPNCMGTIVSDDNGATWQASAILGKEPTLTNANETSVALLTDGRVMLNIRHMSNTHLRAVMTSPNGLDNWSTVHFDHDLPEPICMGAIQRAGEAIVFTNPRSFEPGQPLPASDKRRCLLTIHRSLDNGNTWPEKKIIETGPAAYSDIAADAAGHRIWCLYERAGEGSDNPYDRITVARFEAGWIGE